MRSVSYQYLTNLLIFCPTIDDDFFLLNQICRFTVVLSVIITYAVGMLFEVASALNDPYGFDLYDIKLNQLFASNAIELLGLFTDGTTTHSHMIDPNHDTPSWLEKNKDENDAQSDAVNADTESPHTNQVPEASSAKKSSSPLTHFHLKPQTTLLMVAYLAWCIFIVFLTWGISRHDPKGDLVRWWDVYIPLDSSTAGYVSLGVFLLLGFWITDAYSRYWRALEIWQSEIPQNIDEVSIFMSLTFPKGLWHQRDHERFFSYLASIPYVAKQTLRERRDFSELDAMLSPKDVLRVTTEPKPVEYMFSVLRGYMFSATSLTDLTVDHAQPVATFNIVVIMNALRKYEDLLFECDSLRAVPIPAAFTNHLYLFTCLWLMLLPLTLVLHDGFVAFLYLVPVGYSIINLLAVGSDMSDPFGTDSTDLPMDDFCVELCDRLRTAYRETGEGVRHFVRDTGYDRADFTPGALEQQQTSTDGKEKAAVDESPTGPSFMRSVRTVLQNIPAISPLPVVLYVLWTLVVVFASRQLSYTWPEALRNSCDKWCSPIDVQGSVLANIGFALFMILGFRASDAMKRYEKGAEVLYSLRHLTRSCVLDHVMFHEAGEFHPGDKERFVAHVVQIPLALREIMLDRDIRTGKDTLLNNTDFDRYVTAASPVEYLFQVLSAYLGTTDLLICDEYMENGRGADGVQSARMFNSYVIRLRNVFHEIEFVRSFPVIESFVSHQRLFTILWLCVLPLSMTSSIGFFTILWAPLIAYGIVCLESLTVKLVNPYGTDDIDLPVDEICTETAAEIIEVVNTVNWDLELVNESPVGDPAVGVQRVINNQVIQKDSLLHLKADGDEDKQTGLIYDGITTSEPKPTLYAHLIRSVPWWTLLIVTAWTAVGCLISYLTRDRLSDATSRWWRPTFLISSAVGTYISFFVFVLLGFYVNVAFSRYNTAGDIWEDTLKRACHIATTCALSMAQDGDLHRGDQERFVGHIAALPLVLKSELRGHRDIREVRGLLSYADLGHIQNAPSMSQHCMDVILSYWYAYNRKEMGPIMLLDQFSSRTGTLRAVMGEMEEAINKAFLIERFPIAPGFVTVLNFLLALFSVVLPFILAPITGWLTILWVSLISYGILGMYKVAVELQNPFGSDLNDLPLDEMADEITREIVFVFHQQRNGYNSMLKEEGEPAKYWTQKDVINRQFANVFSEYDSLSKFEKGKHRLKLTVTAISPLLLLLCAAWTAMAVTVAYLVSRYLPQNNADDKACDIWFCSALTIDSSVTSYVGYSLFLLLGFFMYDSHWRFVQGLQCWRVNIKHLMHILTNRWFQGFYPGYYHDGDHERVAGHLAAAMICLKSGLRGELDEERLKNVLSSNDLARVLQCPNRVEHCLDVVRAYRIRYEVLESDENCRRPLHGLEQVYMSKYARNISASPSFCQRIVSVRLPFGYITHVRIFLGVWLLLLPFGIVESTGWISILWVTIISYGVIGVERWAERLSDPFGSDITDLPLDEIVDDLVQSIRCNLRVFDNGFQNFIHRTRISKITTEDSEQMPFEGPSNNLEV